MRMESTADFAFISMAAMDCGIPLPWLPGKKVRVNQAMTINPTGVNIHGNQEYCSCMR